jgi:protein LSM14
LISKSEVRYVGQLAQIDQLKSTVTLQNVRSYGSEGRRLASGLPEIPASSNLFEFIEFRGADIKDLSVVELQQPVAPVPEPPVDPAIVSAVSKPAAAAPAPVAPPVKPTVPFPPAVGGNAAGGVPKPGKC